MLGNVVRRDGRVLVCGTCMDARGLTQDDLVDGAMRSTLDELTQVTLAATRSSSSDPRRDRCGAGCWRARGPPARPVGGSVGHGTTTHDIVDAIADLHQAYLSLV